MCLSLVVHSNSKAERIDFCSDKCIRGHREIVQLLDQGSNFQSQLLCDLYWLLHIDALRTSPYHPQTDGLVERFNQTLNRMLQITTSQEGKDLSTYVQHLTMTSLNSMMESSHVVLCSGTSIQNKIKIEMVEMVDCNG